MYPFKHFRCYLIQLSSLSDIAENVFLRYRTFDLLSERFHFRDIVDFSSVKNVVMRYHSRDSYEIDVQTILNTCLTDSSEAATYFR